MSNGVVTLQQLAKQALVRYQERVALIFGETSVTYAQLDHLSDRAAAGLTHRGVKAGDRVALFLKNCVEYVIADLAIIKMGAVKVPLNHLLSSDDVSYILEHSEASVVIAHQELISSVDIDRSVQTIIVSDDETDQRCENDWRDIISANYGEFTSEGIAGSAPALLMYTGGTTGRPKSVLHTQAGLGLNMLAHITGFEIHNGDTTLLSSPLPHSAGFILLAYFLQGGTVVLLDHFEPESVLSCIEEHSVNSLFLVPTMIYRLLDHDANQDYKTDSLRTIIYGAAPISQKRLKHAIERFGPIFLQIYAQTECPNIGTILKKEDHLKEELQQSCGQAALTTEVRIVDENGNVLPAGEVGEVQFRSGYLLSEYYKSDSKTKEVMKNGWLATGDIGYESDTKHLYLVDRSKDMIISGGLNVYSSEVESAIESINGVKEVAVVGVPHEDWGESIHAVVVRSTPDLSEGDVTAHARARLAKYKIPKTVEFVDALPLTNYGKIDKKKIRSQYWGSTDRNIN